MLLTNQSSGGVNTNLLNLFDDVFEWGSLPIDTGPYAATQALAEAPRADLESGWITDRG